MTLLPLLPVFDPHPYRPLSALVATQCQWCWGWVDDPRHITFNRHRILYEPRPSTGRKTPAARTHRMRPRAGVR